MLILDENDQAIVLHDIKAPVPIDYFWCFDLNMFDFTLTPLSVLTEIIGPGLNLLINGFSFWLPSSWHVLVYDEENCMLDICKSSELPWKGFTAVTYGQSETMVTPSHIRVIDYKPKISIVGPALNNYQMLCHPISPTKWVIVTPNDVYNKYLKMRTTGDLF